MSLNKNQHFKEKVSGPRQTPKRNTIGQTKNQKIQRNENNSKEDTARVPQRSGNSREPLDGGRDDLATGG